MKSKNSKEKNNKENSIKSKNDRQSVKKKSTKAQKVNSMLVIGLIFFMLLSFVMLLATVVTGFGWTVSKRQNQALRHALEVRKKLVERLELRYEDDSDCDSENDNKEDYGDNDYDDEKVDESNSDNNQQTISSFDIEFDRESISGGNRYESEYLTIELPAGWGLQGKYSRNADLDSDDDTIVVSEITITNTDGNTVVFGYVPAFGINLIVPFYFDNSATVDSDLYFSHAPDIKSDLNLMKSLTYGQANCGIYNEAVYCKVEGVDYVEYNGVRTLVFDGGVLTLSKDMEANTWMLTDGVDWKLGDGFYGVLYEGDWDKSELQQLMEVLDTAEF